MPVKKAVAPPPGIKTNAAKLPPARKPTPAPAAAEEPAAEVIDGEAELVEGQEQEYAEARAAQQPIPPAAEVEEETELREPDRTLATVTPHQLGMPIGEIDANDMDIPFLKLAQGDEGASPLIDAFLEATGENINGSFVLAADTIIWQDGWEPIEFTVLRLEKAFMQQLDFGSDEMPKLYKSKADAEADGLIPFGGHEVGYVSYAELVVLIKCPAYELNNINGEPTSQFTEEFGEDTYAIAMWRITGTAYKFGFKKILGQLRTRLRGGFLTGSIKLEARKEKGRLKTYWAPQIRDGNMHDAAMLSFVTDLAGRYDTGATASE